LSAGRETPQLVAAFQALFGPGTDASTYHSGFGDTSRPGELAGIWLAVPPPPRMVPYLHTGSIPTPSGR
jgi:hypothetical protein